VTSADYVLQVRDLSVSYLLPGGPAEVVQNVNLTLGQGELVGLAGESGCGKSTLAHAVARLLPLSAQVTSGQVLYRPPGAAPGQQPVDVLGLAPGELRRFRWRRLSMIFQSAMNSLNPVLTIGAQLADVIRAHDRTASRQDRMDRAGELLDLVGVGASRLRSYPHELSGGMRQRVMLAMSLILNPDVVLMDEPTTALDVVVQRELLDEIRALQQRIGFAALFITHDLSLLLDFADRVAVMYAGRLAEEATVTTLLRGPAHPYSAALLSSFPTVDGPREQRLAAISGTPPAAGARPDGCPFHPRCPSATARCGTESPQPVPFTGRDTAGGHLVSCWNPIAGPVTAGKEADVR
jgi:peptide/nickel transport system ATP-binding protein